MSVTLLDNSNVKMESLRNILSRRRFSFEDTIDTDFNIPECFSKFFDLPLDNNSYDIMLAALADEFRKDKYLNVAPTHFSQESVSASNTIFR